jgi:hypothetical protein
MEDHKKVLSTQILIEVKVEVEVLKLHFEDDTKVCMVDIINMKVNFMEVDKETLEEKEVVKVMIEVTEVNNQITNIVGNMGTWQIIVIKGSMMHKMESCNKGNYASTSNQGDEQLFVM